MLEQLYLSWVGLKLQVCTLMTENYLNHLQRQSRACACRHFELRSEVFECDAAPSGCTGNYKCCHGFYTPATYSNNVTLAYESMNWGDFIHSFSVTQILSQVETLLTSMRCLCLLPFSPPLHSSALSSLDRPWLPPGGQVPHTWKTSAPHLLWSPVNLDLQNCYLRLSQTVCYNAAEFRCSAFVFQ